MNAILTSTCKAKRKGSGLTIVAISASGKVATMTVKSASENTEANHRTVATTLSTKLGWGSQLVGGETREGFAYVPQQERTIESLGSVDRTVLATSLLRSCIADGHVDSAHAYPTSIATGIADIAASLGGKSNS